MPRDLSSPGFDPGISRILGVHRRHLKALPGAYVLDHATTGPRDVPEEGAVRQLA